MRLWRFSALLQISLSFASQIPLRNERPSENQLVSEKLFYELEELARIVDISYCVGTPAAGIQKPFECLSRCKDFDSFELVTAWNTGPLLSDSCGYIALSHAPAEKRIILAFRGTYSITNTIADLSTIPQEYIPYPGHNGSPGEPDAPKCENCTVHMGFHSSWKDTEKVILPRVEELVTLYPQYKLVIVGHSLGGAVAALGALELIAQGYNPTITTFGEPRLGNDAFARYLNQRFNLTLNGTAESQNSNKFRRVTHVDDPVPLLPLEEWGYMPHGGEIFISKGSVPPNLDDVYHCKGSQDQSCSAGDQGIWSSFPWGIPKRYRIWQLFFAHRDYFWRLGLCFPETKWLGRLIS